MNIFFKNQIKKITLFYQKLYKKWIVQKNKLKNKNFKQKIKIKLKIKKMDILI